MNYLHVSKTFYRDPVTGSVVFLQGVTHHLKDEQRARERRARRLGAISARQQRKIRKILRRYRKAL